MDSGTAAQEARPPTATVPSAAAPTVPSTAVPKDDEITFERYAHGFRATKTTSLAEALRAKLGIRKADVGTKTFKRSFLDAELKKLTGSA